MLVNHLYAVVAEQAHHAAWSAGSQAWLTKRQFSHIEGVKTINVFLPADAVGNRGFPDVPR